MNEHENAGAFRRKVLAVIGASYLQLPLVRKAKSMGFRVICFAWVKGAVCKEVCDRFYPISVIEKEKILEVCRQEHVDGITSIASDVAVPTIAYVAEALGLCGNSVESAIKSTDKYQMRKALSVAGIPCPPFVEVDGTDDLAGKVGSLRFPLVVKPVDRSGSMGVAQADDQAQLEQAVKVAVSDSLSGRCIVENCITNMREVSVEGISWQGHYRMLAITDKVTTGCPHYVELAHHQPARVNDHLKGRVEDVVRRAVSALGITVGATHAELMITASDELYVTEVGARMGGDFIGSSLVQLSTGYDFLKAVVQCAMGGLVEQGPQPHQCCSGVWFYAPQTKWVKDVIVQKSDQRIIAAELQKDNAVELTRSADRSGYFIYAGEDRWEASLA